MLKVVQHIIVLVFGCAIIIGGNSKSILAQNVELQQAQRAFDSGEYQKAIDWSEKALELDSLNNGAYQLQAASNLALMNFSKTIQTANRGLELFPNSSPLIWFKSEALLQQGLFEKALNGYQKLLTANSNIAESEIRLRLGFVYQSLGGRHYVNKKYKLAEESFRNAKTYMPDSLASYSNLALALMQQEKWEEALKVIDEGREIYPESEVLLQMRLNVLFERRDFSAMLNEYEEIYQRNPSDIENGIKYAELLLAQNERERSEKVYEELLEKYPHERKIYTSLVKYFEARGNYEAQRGALRKMLEVFKDDADVMRQIAETYNKQEQWEQARAALDSAATFGGDLTKITALKANTFLQQDSLDAAINAYEKTLNQQPKDRELLFLKASVEEKATYWQKAERTYLKIIDIKPTAIAYKYLGRVYLELNNKEKAQINFEEAKKFNPKDAYVNYQLASFYYGNNEIETAFELGVYALKLALKEIETFQKNLSVRFQNNTNLESFDNLEDMEVDANIYPENEKVVADAFYFLTNSYDKNLVLPLMRELKEEYPLSGKLFYMISGYYLKIGNKDEGIELLKESVTLSPRLSEAQLDLGEYYEEHGEFTSAFIAFERVISTDPENRAAYKKLIELHRENGTLDQLCDRWMTQLRVKPNQPILKEFLIEALHKAGRFEEASDIIQSGRKKAS